MTEGKAIVCVGIMVADVIGDSMQSLPKRAELVLVDRISLFPGGCAVNTASALARLGLTATLVGKVGSDHLGDFILNVLTERGVNIEGVERDLETGTSASMVMVDPDGERRFVHYIGANACLMLEDIDPGLIEDASILHVAGSNVLPGLDGGPTAELLRLAHSVGATTVLDTVWDATGRWLDVLGPCLPHLDYFVPSLSEARAMTNLEEPAEVARALLDRGVGTIGLKMGAAGCLLMTSDGCSLALPAYEVDVVDATGAGDAFAAGFIAGLWHRWPLERVGRLANAVGALCVTGHGAEGGLRSLDDTLTFMERTPLRQASKQEASFGDRTLSGAAS